MQTRLSDLINGSYVGYTGSQGITGYTGSQGITGYTGSAGSSDTITATNETSTDTHYPVFVNSAGIETAAKVKTTDIPLSYVPSTGVLTAVSFVGNLSGNASTSSSLQTSRNINGVSFNGSSDVTVPGNFVNRTVDELGHVVFVGTSPTGNQTMHTNENYRFNPNSGELFAINFNSTSDESKKTDIKTITDAVDTVKKLRGVWFKWKHNDKSSVGVIAQEIEQHLPEVVTTEEGTKTVSYGNIVGLLIEAIKEQQKQIEDIQTILHNKLL